MDVIDVLIERIKKSRRYYIGTYEYFVWPYKGIDPLPPQELTELAKVLRNYVPQNIDYLLSFMVDGEIIALPLSILMNTIIAFALINMV